MQRELGMAMILISHDLGVVSGVCDRVMVMYAGRVVERASTTELFRHPRHPYNRALQQSIPALQVKGTPLHTIPGLPPDLSKPVAGCAFAPRCEFAQPECLREVPRLVEVAPGHTSACLRVQKEGLPLALKSQ
jgi:oligopeptide transport system ATP-binding protein